MIVETPERPKKRSHSSPEGRIQAECFSWFWNEFPQYRKTLFHVPNENDRADSNIIQGAIRKSLGVVSGVADLILMIKRGGYGALCIEMKDERGKQKPAQIEWQAIIERQGYKYEVCRSLEQFKLIINEYLNL
jgi:hypothetical protein